MCSTLKHLRRLHEAMVLYVHPSELTNNYSECSLHSKSCVYTRMYFVKCLRLGVGVLASNVVMHSQMRTPLLLQRIRNTAIQI
jgi:hypothetical protein